MQGPFLLSKYANTANYVVLGRIPTIDALQTPFAVNRCTFDNVFEITPAEKRMNYSALAKSYEEIFQIFFLWSLAVISNQENRWFSGFLPTSTQQKIR